MKETKFRAWDGKKMQYDVFPTSDNTVGRWIETGGGIELRFCDGGGTKVDIMQYIGEDKNNKEIYDGDIVKTPAGQILPIEVYDLIEGDAKFRSIPLSLCEVIGNVHENKKMKVRTSIWGYYCNDCGEFTYIDYDSRDSVNIPTGKAICITCGRNYPELQEEE